MTDPYINHFACRPRRQQGFTLVEMVVAVVVLGILAAIALPSVESFIDSNRSLAFNRQLETLLLFARTQAVLPSESGKAYVAVCQRDGASNNEKQLLVERLDSTATMCMGNPSDVLRVMDIPSGITVNTQPANLIARFNRNGTLVPVTGSSAGTTNQAILVSCLHNDYRNGFTTKIYNTGRITSGVRGEKLTADESQANAAKIAMTSCLPEGV